MRFNERISRRRLNSILTTGNDTSLELDTHADTSVLGKDALIFLDHQRPVNVHGYDPALGSKKYRTVSGALAYDHPETGQVYHILINQAIEIPTLDHCLLCPFQCRVNDVIIHDTPKFLTQNPTVASHAITVPDPDKPGQLLHLPLALDGVTSYLPVRKPTADEFRSGNFARIELTSQHLTWDPSDPTFATQESNTMDKDGEIYNRNPTPTRHS
jgi:hypothetical protein